MLAKFQAFCRENVTNLGSVQSRAQAKSLHIAISFAVAISINERPGNLREASKFVLL